MNADRHIIPIAKKNIENALKNIRIVSPIHSVRCLYENSIEKL